MTLDIEILDLKYILRNYFIKKMITDNENNLPIHVAIVPDGNRRWAKERGLNPWEGHEAGAQNTEKLLRKALAMGVKCLSLWGSSVENLAKRPLLEKKELFKGSSLLGGLQTKIGQYWNILKDKLQGCC